MLASGLVGTPFALVLVLYLLNDPAVVPERNSQLANIGGVVLIAITSVLAGSFVRGHVTDGFDPVTLFVGAFTVVLTAASIGLAGKFVREAVTE